ncbi:hypothetical protein T11_17895 [Trichinella zimbabwensis]|uniref:Uncharacterized protein n=1 Tax=Trichinella zimbabwensis TaxID=268475 RepID=A0A0V1GTB4_9BILA|nr:hypothetical protein T11_17895 [Trichinella zimbabwensis]
MDQCPGKPTTSNVTSAQRDGSACDISPKFENQKRVSWIRWLLNQTVKTARQEIVLHCRSIKFVSTVFGPVLCRVQKRTFAWSEQPRCQKNFILTLFQQLTTAVVAEQSELLDDMEIEGIRRAVHFSHEIKPNCLLDNQPACGCSKNMAPIGAPPNACFSHSCRSQSTPA